MGKWFVLLYWAWIVSEVLLQVITRTSRSSGTTKDRGSLPLLLITIFGALWAATSYGNTHAHTIPGDPRSLAVAAMVLMLAGSAIRWGAIVTLGVSFSTNVAIHKTQSLRTTGLFRWMRHPSYTGMLLNFAAIGVYERNWISLAMMLAIPMLALIYRIRVEERALGEAFGKDYADYSRITSRLVPGIY